MATHLLNIFAFNHLTNSLLMHVNYV
ncbi:hypothetical protein TRIP_B30013 [uncultured Desulfatiglans sp.]|uniref:Uncharacterized protein n=1 Tax=Uncultured Desulfatiglans sp. TaxID=1748965 RepID=A0A653A6J6_UNCDX|nr:hypothetical protein TRIP_B30013 [uncultured Desulfatiglans sp.]